MSTQRGNNQRTRAQRYKNKRVFKNDLHDTSHTIKKINAVQVCEVCVRCKDIIDWKIKYKKYKIPSQPGVCIKCSQRNVTRAYHVMCSECSKKLGLCAKCSQAKNIIPTIPNKEEQLKLDTEVRNLLKILPERKRRSFLRYANKKHKETEPGKDIKDDLVTKIENLKIDDAENSEDLDDSELDNSDFDSDFDE